MSTQHVCACRIACSVAVSVTGVGEPIMRCGLAHRCGNALLDCWNQPVDEVLQREVGECIVKLDFFCLQHAVR
jgi:isoaspartyl peptidase/L-asparaginase-like protein (Ntn-hydrolase superfamily)